MSLTRCIISFQMSKCPDLWIFFVATLLVQAYAEESIFKLFRHKSQDAKCLDGSPAVLYFAPGKQLDKFVLYFEGGGLCFGQGLNGVLDSCLKRSESNLGSSKNYSEFRSFATHPMLTENPELNPEFHDWNRVYIPYCDGSLHQGYKSQPINYKGKDLYFRGEKNTLTHFEFLETEHNFFSAKKIVITGTSAGGLATYIWGNHVYHNALLKQAVFLMPDSGIFATDFVNPWTNRTFEYYTQYLLRITNAESHVPMHECLQKYPTQVECFQAGNIAELILPPTLVIQSTYDAWGLQQILGLKCLSSPAPSSIQSCNDTARVYIEEYHKELENSIQNYTKVERHSVWSIGCAQHGFIHNNKSIENKDFVSPYPSGRTLQQAIHAFLRGQKVSQVDDSVWPSNKGCDGLNDFSLPNVRSE